MIPLLTTTPNNIKNPVIVFGLSKLLLVINKPMSEPIAANGIVNSSTNGVTTDSNTDAKIINIRMSEAKIKNLNSVIDSSVRSTSIAIPLGKL